MTSLLELGRAYAELPDEQCAGMLVTTSVPDRPVSPERMRDLMQREGLDATLVPVKVREVDAFANACRAVQTRRGQVGDERQIVTVGEIDTNATESIYQITAEARDKTNRVIEHRKGMRVVYDKSRAGDPVVGHDCIRFEPIDDTELYRSLHTLADTIQMQFFARRGMLTGAKVREILRTTFSRLHTTRWANSTHFVSMEHKTEVLALKTVVKELYGADATFRVVKLPNVESTRTELGDAISTHVNEDAQKLIAQVGKQLRGGEPVTQRQFDSVLAAKKEIAAHADKMQEMLGGEVATVKDAVALLDEQVMEMWARVA